jgi:transcription initiation factor IIF auxiliary subunit
VPLSINQSQEYVGNDRWKWSVWLDGTQTEISDIDRVVYILHPTFHKPVREITDRSTNFRLNTSGWGTFRLYAKAIHRDGRETTLNHDLVLQYPDGTPTAA